MICGRGFEVGGADVLLEGVDRAEKLHAEALAAAIVLRDERRGHVSCGVEERLGAAGHGARLGDEDAGAVEGLILADLAHFELEGGESVDDAAPVAFEPRQDLPRVIDAAPVPARVRRGAHPVEEHALGRGVEHVEVPFVDEPLVVRHAPAVERVAQRRKPFGVFVEDRDVHGRGWMCNVRCGVCRGSTHAWRGSQFVSAPGITAFRKDTLATRDSEHSESTLDE